MTKSAASPGSRTPNPWKSLWLSSMIWVLAAGVTSFLLLSFAHSMRVSDTKRQAQFLAAGDHVFEPLVGDSATWSLFVSDDNQDAGPQALCNLVTPANLAAHRMRVVWIDSAGALAPGRNCGAPGAASGQAGIGLRRASSEMRRARLGLLLVDSQGRYVFGGRSGAADLRVVSMFAAHL